MLKVSKFNRIWAFNTEATSWKRNQKKFKGRPIVSQLFLLLTKQISSSALQTENVHGEVSSSLLWIKTIIRWSSSKIVNSIQFRLRWTEVRFWGKTVSESDLKPCKVGVVQRGWPAARSLSVKRDYLLFPTHTEQHSWDRDLESWPEMCNKLQNHLHSCLGERKLVNKTLNFENWIHYSRLLNPSYMT